MLPIWPTCRLHIFFRSSPIWNLTFYLQAFQIEPASLGFDLGTAFVVIIIRIKPPGALLGSGWFAVCGAVRIFPRRGSLLFSGTADIMTIK